MYIHMVYCLEKYIYRGRHKVYNGVLIWNPPI